VLFKYFVYIDRDTATTTATTMVISTTPIHIASATTATSECPLINISVKKNMYKKKVFECSPWTEVPLDPRDPVAAQLGNK